MTELDKKFRQDYYEAPNMKQNAIVLKKKLPNSMHIGLNAAKNILLNYSE